MKTMRLWLKEHDFLSARKGGEQRRTKEIQSRKKAKRCLTGGRKRAGSQRDLRIGGHVGDFTVREKDVSKAGLLSNAGCVVTCHHHHRHHQRHQRG